MTDVKNLSDCDITEVRALLHQSLRDDDATKNEPRFMARLERLIDLKIQNALSGYQRTPFRMR